MAVLHASVEKHRAACLGVSEQMQRIEANAKALVLRSTGFVALAGEPGTGKRWLAARLAPLVTVRPDMLDAADSRRSSECSIHVDLLPHEAQRHLANRRPWSVWTMSEPFRRCADRGHLCDELLRSLEGRVIDLPPVHNRQPEDLRYYVHQVIAECVTTMPHAPRRVDEGAWRCLLEYDWPGNVREIRCVIERAMILGQHALVLSADHLPVEFRDHVGTELSGRSLAEVERSHIDRTVRDHGGNRTQAARALGISRATLINKIKAYQLNV